MFLFLQKLFPQFFHEIIHILFPPKKKFQKILVIIVSCVSRCVDVVLDVALPAADSFFLQKKKITVPGENVEISAV